MAKTFTLPSEGTSPNAFATLARDAGMLSDSLSARSDAQEIGKSFRRFLRGKYQGTAHVPHTSWGLTRTHMLELLAAFGSDKGRTFAANASKRKPRAKKPVADAE